jgi:hypothetical protein
VVRDGVAGCAERIRVVDQQFEASGGASEVSDH